MAVVRMRFRLLGPVDVDEAGQSGLLGGPRQLAVLAALLVRANETVGLPYLCEAVWEVPPNAAESNIRTYVAKLRRLLGERGLGDRLTTGNRGYHLAVAPGELDLNLFEEAIGQGQHAARADQHQEAADAFASAVALWRGDAFGNAALGPVLRAEQARLAEKRVLAAEGLARARIALGAADTVVADLHQLVAEHPTREELAALLMLALHRTGRQADALALFTRIRRRLVEELGIEPGARLTGVHQEILTDEPAHTPAPPNPVPAIRAQHQLPMDPAGFTGRTEALDELYRFVEQEADKTVAIGVITGMAGVGKTRLAVHAAHELMRRGQFTELQLWADLRGFAPEAQPVDPAGVLTRFLVLLGVPPDRVPGDPADRAVLYRDRLAGRRTLVLLDNAADEEQVRPLLPGSAGNVVLVTSRRTLPDLDGVHVVHLDVFDTDNAITLLARVAGTGRVLADRDAAVRVVELCGRLPIAITIAAQQLRNRPKWTVRDLMHRLEAATDRLEALHGRSRAVRAVFDLSYRMLPPGTQRVFQLTGLHPAEDFTAVSVAALAGVDPEGADRMLEELADEHLLTEVAPGRFHSHDLVRLYTRASATAHMSDVDIGEALRRLLTWYLYAAASASRLVNPAGRPVPLDPDLSPRHLPVFGDRDAALDWFEQERGALVAMVRLAIDRDEHAVAWQLPCACLSFFYLRKHWDDWVVTHRLGLTAANRAGDLDGKARILNGLGVAHSDLGQLDEAVECHHAATELFGQLGDALGQAWNLNNLGVAYDNLGRYAEAADCYLAALPLFREADHSHGESIALSNLGDAYRAIGLPDKAMTRMREALEIQLRTGDRAAQRFTLTSLGDLQRDTGQRLSADTSFRRALAIARDLDDRRTTAKLLRRIAGLRQAAGKAVAARTMLREAHTILLELGDPDAIEVAEGVDDEEPTTRISTKN
jgi:DNA-binding SARP family transcriptional activator/tetratricopeptide (TPR) repeat protein